LSDSTTVRLFSNALLDMDGTNEAFGGLSGDTGTRVDLSGGARLITGLNNASTAFSGTIFGDGSLVKNGTGTLTLNGINIYSGGTTVSDGTLKVLNGSGTGTGSLTATSGGIVDIADDLIVENGKTLTVSSGGLVDVAFNLDLSGGADLIVDNATVSAGNLNVTSSGSLLNMTAASINADVNITNASLSGTGTINGNLTGIGAEFGPGNSPGLLTINGDFSQDGNSSILFELAGTIAESEYDVVDISGTANLAGELVIDWFDNGGGLFSASEGDVFDIFSAETILGEFDLLSFAVLGGTLDWKLSYLFDEFGTTDVLRLSVIDTSAVPIPAAVWLFGSGLLGLIGMARQKQT
ncbi:MAG: fibronectin-binding autotransporter adhesin, partial [Gammaproteobacteria bacterium]